MTLWFKWINIFKIHSHSCPLNTGPLPPCSWKFTYNFFLRQRIFYTYTQHTHTHPCLLTEKFRNNDKSVAMSTILRCVRCLNIILWLKGIRIPWRNNWFQAWGQGKYNVNIDIFLWHEIQKSLKINENILKGYRSHSEGFPLAKSDGNETHHTEPIVIF